MYKTLVTNRLSWFRTEHKFLNFTEISNRQDYEKAISNRDSSSPMVMLGNGSNCLFARKKVKSFVVKNKLPKEYTPADVLQHMLEPSKKIDKKYASSQFAMASGKIVSGLVVKEDENTVSILDNPTAPQKVRVLNKDDIDDRVVSKVSIMPQGVLNKLTKEEILDVLAYVVSGGNKKSPLFAEHHH